MLELEDLEDMSDTMSLHHCIENFFFWLMFLLFRIEVVYSNLMSFIKSMRAWNSCSGVVEMYQLVELIGDCVLGVSFKLSGMSLA